MGEVGGLSSSNNLRFMGMASGVDTDSMVKKMLVADKVRIGRVDAAKQKLQWKQELYRDVIKDMNSLKSKYFDILSKDCILSQDGFLDNKVESSNNFIATAKAYSGSAEGTYKIKVNELATGATLESTSELTVANKSVKITDLVAAGSYSFDIEYSGSNGSATRTITLDNSAGDKTLNDLMNAISNATEADVVAKYSELTKKFTMTTSKTGVSSSIKVTAGSGSLGEEVLQKLNIGINTPKTGTNSKVEITPPGSSTATIVEKETNAFTIDGVSYNLNSKSTSEVTLNVTSDTDSSFKKIKSFIDDYNKMIDKVYEKVEEKVSYRYKPLTEEQKKDMSKEEIERWESKAKEGLLRGDYDLKNMLKGLRTAFFDVVDGAGIKFDEKSLGIGTSSDIGERGKVIIKDEAKFKEKLKTNGEQIMRLFVKTSDISYSRNLSPTDKAKRFSEEGIFNRISDVLNDYISPMRDKSGKKATLLEKAGFEKDTSFINNMLTKQIEEKEKLIKEMTIKMSNKEDKYYQMFARLEKAMNGLNAQSNWFSSQMGMGR